MRAAQADPRPPAGAEGPEARAGAFERLRRLLRGAEPPSGAEPVLLHLGEVGVAPPARLLGPLARAEDWSRYPPLGGTQEQRRAYAGWLSRRFGLPEDPAAAGLAIEPTAGSKHAIAVAVSLAAEGAGGAGRPAVVMPSPFYPTYLAAAAAAGAEPIFYPTARGRVARAIGAALERAAGRAAAVILCNPGTPDGDPVDEADLAEAAERARRAGAVLVVDECYVDLFDGEAPTGMLALCGRGAADPGGVLVLHTLSKRSGAPGLRSGFAAGDPAIVARYAERNRTCGVSSPFPVCAAAAALWADEDHARRVRDAVARNWDLADARLGGVPGYRRARTGFFLWLAVEDGEETASRLWARHGIMVMPGRYLAADDADGRNPGAGRVRIALVQEPERMSESLRRLRAALDAGGPGPDAGGPRPDAGGPRP